MLWLLDLIFAFIAAIQTRVERITLKVLSAGPIPRHVAFIMDGNRRYARGRNMEVFRGHEDGFKALRHLLELCGRLDIKCISVYAFAIENFKRPPEEVNALMKLAKEKLLELSGKGDLLEEYGIRVCFPGRTSLLPQDVQEAVQKVVDSTKHHNRSILNVCMPYAARDEMATAIEKSIDQTLSRGEVITSITEETIDANLMTTSNGSPHVDILVRTSDVRRFSDFMTWQCSEGTQVHFVSCLWPEFGMREFVPIILAYQRKVWAHQRTEGVHAKKAK